MDYFKFDLQLFADVTVDFKAAGAPATTGTGYLAKIGDAAPAWFASLKAITDAAELAGETATLLAEVTGNVATVAIGAADGTVTITGSETTAAALKDLTVVMTKELTISTDTEGVSKVVVDTTTGMSGTVTFSGTATATLNGLSVKATTMEAIGFTSTASNLFVPANAVVTAGDNQYKAVADSVLVIDTTASTGVSQLLSGTVDVAHGDKLTVATTTYMENGADTSVARIKATIGTDENGDPVPATAGELLDIGTGDAKVASSVSVEGETGAVIIGTRTITKSADATLTATSAGVLSGMNASTKFSVADGSNDTLTTYKGASAALTVGGDEVGTYALGADKIGDTTITLQDGKDAVKVGGADAELVTATGAYTLTYAADKAAYWLGADGKLTAVAAETNVPVDGSALGYFVVSEKSNFGSGIATITFYNAPSEDAEHNFVPGTVSQALGNFTFELGALTKADGADLKSLVFADDCTSGTITATGVASAVGPNISGLTSTELQAVKYSLAYAVEGKITLSDMKADADSAIWALVPSGATGAEGDATNYGVRTYTLTNVGSVAAAGENGYFTVDPSDAGDGKVAYAVTFTKGNLTEAILKDSCWAGITVDADGLTLTKTTGVTITGAATTDHKDTYKVDKVAYGINIDGANAGITRKGTPTPSIVFHDGSGDVAKLLLGDGTVDGPVIWNVTDIGDNATTGGNPKYQIKQDANTTPDATSYFTIVTNTAKKTVTVTYTNGGIDLAAITKDTLPIAVTGNTIPKEWTIEFAAADAGIYYDVTAKGGTTVTGADKVTYDAALSNGVVLDLSLVEADNTDTFFLVKSGTKDAGTNLTPIVFDKVQTEAVTDASVSYFTVTRTSGTQYAISWHKGTAIDLGVATTVGDVTIKADGTVTKVAVTKAAAGEDGITYHVTGATEKILAENGITQKIGDAAATDKTNQVTKADDTSIYTTYVEVNKLSTTPAENTIALAGLKTDTDTHKKLYYVVSVKTGPTRGGTTYQLAKKGDGYTALAASESGFILTYDADKKSITMEYQVGTGTGISVDTLATLTSNFNLDATLATGANAPTVETIYLTEDVEGVGIGYAVDKVPTGVAVENVTQGKDTVAWDSKFSWATGGDTLSLADFGATEGVYYIPVRVTASDKGLYTIAIDGEPLVNDDTPEAERIEALAGAGNNYFVVTVADDTSDNNVTITYHMATGATETKINLNQSTLNIDANDANDSANFTINSANGTQPEKIAAVNITGLEEGNSPVDNSATTVTGNITRNYNQSYKITGSINLQNLSGGTKKYYAVEYTPAVTTATDDSSNRGENTYAIQAADDDPPVDKEQPYFMVTYNSQYVATVTYVNPTGKAEYNLQNTGELVTINGAGLAVTVDTLDITDMTTPNSAVNYDVSGIKGTVNVVGATEGDVVSKDATAVLTGSITLTDKAEMYYVINGTKDEKGNYTCTLGEGTEAEPTDKDTKNYVVVTQDEDGDFTVEYVPAHSGDAFKLDSKSKLTVDAAVVETGNTLNVADAWTVNVTNAKGGIGTVTGAATITYKQPKDAASFDGEPGVYYIKKDAEAGTANFPDSLQASITKDDHGTTFVKVTLKQDIDGKYTLTVADEAYAPNENTGFMDGSGTHGATLSMIGPDEANSVLDVSNVAFTEITGLASGAVLTGVNEDTKVSANLKAGESISVTKDGETDADVFTAAVDGTITVLDRKAYSGVFSVGKGETLNGADTSVITLTVAADKGNVLVTFTDGNLTSITGLGTDETLDVKMGEKTYRYTYDGTRVTKTLSVAPFTAEKAGMASDTNILGLGYTEGDTLSAGAFEWKAGETGKPKTYYVGTGAAADGTIALANTTPATVENGKYYVQAIVSGTNNTLKLTPLKANSALKADPTEEFTGTVTVNMNGVATPSFTKDSDNYKVDFTNVATGATFTDLSDGDKVTTVELPKDTGNVIMQFTKADGSVDNAKTATYTRTGTNGTLVFTGAALTDGVVKLTAGSKTLTASLTKQTIYTSSTYDAVVTFENGEIKKIEGVSAGESVTLVDADGTITTYTTSSAVGKDKEVVMTVEKNGEKTNTLLTVENAGDDILHPKTEDTKHSKQNNFPAWNKDGVAFFKLDTENTPMDTTVTTSEDEVTYKNGDYLIKATVAYDAETGSTLTLTPMIVVNGEPTVDVSGYTNGAMVNVTAGATKVVYDGTGKGFNVAFSDIVKDSSLAGLTEGDKVVTVNTLAADDVVKVNGTEYKATATTQFKFYHDADDLRITSGKIYVTGTVKSTTDTPAEASNITLTYTEGDEKTSKDGVKVYYNNGAVSTIEDLNVGETVIVKNEKTGVTTTYYAKSDTIIWKTVAGYTGDEATKNGTFITTLGSAGNDVVAGGTGTDAYTKSVATESEFSWTFKDGETSPKTAYFLVDGSGDEPKYTAEIEAQTTKLTIDHENVGATVVVASLTKATESTPATLTLAKRKVIATGALSSTGTDGTWAAGDVKNLTITLPSTGMALIYNKQTGVDNVAILNAGAGSVFAGNGAGDTVTTVRLAEGDAITVGGHIYMAGEANTSLKIDGVNVVNGTFRLTTPGTTTKDNITSSVTDSTTKVTTDVTVVYEAKDTLDSGVNVKMEAGAVKKLTGLADGETVSIMTRVTQKDGSFKDETITYAATKNAKGGILVTKKLDDDTEYTHTFANDTLDVWSETDWTISKATISSIFDWSNTGYFEAVKVTAGEDMGKFALTGAIAADGSKHTVQPSTADTTRYYLTVTGTKDLAGNYKVASDGIVLMQAQTNGTLKPVTDSYELTEIAVTAPADGGLTLPDDHAGVFAITAVTGGSTYTIGTNDKFTVTDLAATTVTVNGTSYTGYGTATNMFVRAADGSVTQGNLAVGTTELTDVTGAKIVAGKDSTVNVVFNATKGITAITGMAANESVTVTKDGIKTTYSAKTGASNLDITKTVTEGEVTETWTKTDVTANTAEITGLAYSVAANTFSWADNKVGYFAANGDPLTATINAAVNPQVDLASNTYYVRAVASGNKTDGYTVKSIKVYKTGATDTVLTDVTSDPATKTAFATAGISIVAPTDGNLTLAADAVAPEKDKTTRTFAIHVTGAQAGKTYIGFAATDTITSDPLAAGSLITVGLTAETAKTYATAAAGEVIINGDGTADTGTFDITASTTVTMADGSVVSTDGAARVKLANGAVSAITEVGAGETAVITTTNAETKKVTTTTYAVTAGTGEEEGKLVVTRTVEADSVKTISRKTITDATKDVVKDDGAYTVVSGGVDSDFNWTAKNGSGYFLVGTMKDTTELGTVAVSTATAVDSITSSDAGKYYVKVALSADGVISGVTLEKVQADGTLAVDAAKDITDNTKITKGVVNITAPADLPITYNNEITNDKLAVNITGAIKGSDIQAMKLGDTLKTADLTKGDKLKVGGNELTAAENGAMSFVGNCAMLEGKITNTAAFKIAGGSVNSAADDATVAVTAGDDNPVITVKNGAITQITGLKATTATPPHTGGTVVATVTGGGPVITYSADDNNKLTAAVTGTLSDKTFTVAQLDEGTTFKVGGTDYISGAAGNAITFVYEGTRQTIKDGALQLSASGTLYATGTDSAATPDDVKVEYTKAAGSAGAVVTFQNGAIAGIKGLAKGEKVVVTDDVKKTVTTYFAENSATQIKKTVEDKSVVPSVTTEYVGTIAAGADVTKASYAGGTATVDTEEGKISGQFAWNDATNTDSKRTTGYFVMKKNATTIQDQPSVVSVTKPSAATIYAVGTVSEGESLTGGTARALSIGALMAKPDGTTEGYTLTTADKITVAAPTGQAVQYAKDGVYQVTLSKVAANSVISGLETNDTLTTATLAVGEAVSAAGTTYYAGSKNALTFIGEGTNAADTATTALLTGVIALSDTQKTAKLAGATAAADLGSVTNDVTVTVAGTREAGLLVAEEKVIVAAKNGVVTSITGLETQGATVTLNQNGVDTVYTVMYAEPVFNSKGVQTGTTVMVSRKVGTNDPTFATFTVGKNIYATENASGAVSNGYKVAGADTPTNVDQIWSAAAATPVYVEAGNEFAKGAAATIAAKTAERGKLYDVMTVKTTNGVTTISNIVRAQVNAQGVPTTVKGVTVPSAIINGTNGDSFAKISYKVPTTMALTATHVALGSVFTGLNDGDFVTTETTKGSFVFGTDGKSVTVYKAGTNGTETAVYTTKTKGVTLTMTGGTLKAAGFTAGSLSVVSTTEADGKVQTDYVYDKKGVLTRTITKENGAKEVYALDSSATGVEDGLIGVKFAADPTISQVVSDFNWTMDKNKTGYFAVNASKRTAAVKAVPTTIKNANANYIAVTLTADGVVGDISQKVFDATAIATDGMKDTASKFSGTISITAPATALTLDRTAALNGDTIDTTAEAATTAATLLAISGAAKNSVIEQLANGDTVTTAKLKTGESIAVTKAGDEAFDYTSNLFTAGANGALAFKVQTVGGADTLALTGGTIALASAAVPAMGGTYVYAGDTLIEATARDGGVPSTITVTAKTTTKKGVSTTAYTIGGLEEGEKFTINEKTTYMKSGSTLLRTTTDSDDVYTLAWTKSSVTGSDLASTKWVQATPTFTTEDDGFTKTSNFGAILVDLATLDKRVATDKAASTQLYEFVVDKYLAPATRKTGLTAAVINTANELNLQEVVGSANNLAEYVYQATAAIAQTIKASNFWTVNGSDGADIITGAAKGTDTLSGGAGNDTITGGKAVDVFEVGAGNDVVKSYAKNDQIVLDSALDGFQVKLNATATDATNKNKTVAGVLLYDVEHDDGTTDNSVLLVGMGNRTAVNINGVNYYFGSDNNKTKAETFAYDTAGNAYYYGKAGLNHVVSVGTDNKKATAKTLGDTVAVNLSDTAHYVNIAEVNAAKSGNRLDLTASATGSTLRGGTYETTLRGGVGSDLLVGGSKGADTFWFESGVDSNDTITSYTAKNDKIFLANQAIAIREGDAADVTIKGSGNDVQFVTDSGNTLTLQKAVGATNAINVLSVDGDEQTTLSYYVGATKSKSKNNFVATLGTDTDTVTGGELKSYYIGSTTDATITDTLSVKMAAVKKGDVPKAVNATFSLQSANLMGIDVLDTSAISYKGVASKVTLQGATSGSYTLKGEAKGYTTDHFDLADLEQGSNAVTISNININEVIELGVGVKATGTYNKKKNICTYTLTDATDKSLGTLTVTGVKGLLQQSTDGDTNHVKLTRTL